MNLIFEWHEKKARQNLAKHRIGFDEAVTVFRDPLLISFPDETHAEEEDRLISIGYSASTRVLLIVHTETELRGDRLVIRIISCRKATPAERKVYEGGG